MMSSSFNITCYGIAWQYGLQEFFVHFDDVLKFSAELGRIPRGCHLQYLAGDLTLLIDNAEIFPSSTAILLSFSPRKLVACCGWTCALFQRLKTENETDKADFNIRLMTLSPCLDTGESSSEKELTTRARNKFNTCKRFEIINYHIQTHITS